MELGPIFRAMTRNKVGVCLLLLQIGLTLIIVLNATGIVSSNLQTLQIPSGLAVDELMTVGLVSYGERFKDPSYFKQVMDKDLDSIRALPGVIDSCAISVVPLQGGGSSGRRIRKGDSPSTAVRVPRFVVDSHFLKAMGLKLEAGRNFVDSDFPSLPSADQDSTTAAPTLATNVIVTKALADALFPDGDGLGKQITDTDGANPETIVGIVSYMYTPYDNGASGMEYRSMFEAGIPGDESNINYLIRMEKSSYKTNFTAMEALLDGLQSDRLVSSRSMAEVQRQGNSGNRFAITILSWLTVLLFLVTALGIYGMTSFSVENRYRQIGVRRALGATQSDIIRYFMLEIGLICAVGLVGGLTLGFPLNHLLVTQIPGLQPVSILLTCGCVAAIFATSFASVAIPAIKAASIPPVIATRSV